MRPVIARKTDLDALIARLRETRTVYAPVREGDGTAFAPVSTASQIALGRANTPLSAKGLFFPQREVLLSFRGKAMESAPLPTEAFAVFGARPCDARALGFLDRVFGSAAGRAGNAAYEDPYYLERRKLGLVFALACDDPQPECFCASVGGDPHGGDGADVSMSAIPTGFLLKAVTPKGESFLESLGPLLRPADDEELRAGRELAKAALAALRPLDLSGVKSRLDAAFDSPEWKRVSETCLGCGACTYLCPACHCFDITDEPKGAGGGRVRSWDSCQYALFTAHASGHNPRPAKRERMRQRLMHKFSFAVDAVGTVLCSGCGRCIRCCPVGLDIREMLRHVGGSS